MSTEVKDFETLKRTDTRKAAYAVVLVAMGVALAPYTSFPIGIAKVNPTQHFVNVIGALLLGPWWAVAIATIIAVLRNAMGLGTLLAFPGGMIGAFLAGFFIGIPAIFTRAPPVKSSAPGSSRLWPVPCLSPPY